MSAEQEKATAFVGRLLANPALQSTTPLQREEQIIQFLHANAAQLAPTLASGSFFPGKSWNQIVALLIQGLMGEVDKQLIPETEQLAGSVDFAFVNHLRQQAAGSDKIRPQFVEFLKALLKKPDARRSFTGSYAALKFRLLDKYVDKIWARKSYVHFELTKVQRLRMSKEDIRSMIEATLLLKPIVSLVSTGNSPGQVEQGAGIVQTQFAEKVVAAGRKHLSLLPEQVIKSGISASISFIENRFIEATARLAAIFSARCRNYQPNVRVDRGADSPDKSWLSISRRNYKFYGFDIKMLDELYSIAAENGW